MHYTVHWNAHPANSRRTPISSGMFIVGFTQISGSSLATVGEAVAPICTPYGDANDANIFSVIIRVGQTVSLKKNIGELRPAVSSWEHGLPLAT